MKKLTRARPIIETDNPEIAVIVLSRYLGTASVHPWHCHRYCDSAISRTMSGEIMDVSVRGDSPDRLLGGG